LYLKQFRYIIKVAELQNITLAAKELFVSQPSLSHYIKKIEKDIGAELFDRNTTPLSLTQAGKKFVETGKEIIEKYDNMTEEIAKLSMKEYGKIKIGMPHSRAAYMLPPVLLEFSEKYPNINIETIETKSSILIDYVERGKIDFAVLPAFKKELIYNKNLGTEIIYNEQLYLISGKPLNSTVHDYGNIYTLKQFDVLSNEKFILLEKGHGIRYAVDKIFDKYNFEPKVLIETTSNETAYRLSVLGQAVAIVPEISLELFRSKVAPYVYKIGAKGESWEVIAIYNEGRKLSNASKLFLEILKSKF